MSGFPTVRRCARKGIAVWLLSALVFPAAVLAQTVSIEPGASWRIGDAAMDLDCAVVDVAGALHAQDGRIEGIGDLGFSGQVTASTAAIEVGGNWSNHGSFLPGTGTVRFVDRCDRAQGLIGGATAFSSLRVESARAKAYRFEAGKTQSIDAVLSLIGATGQYLSIGSTQAGARAQLALVESGGQQIAWASVADMDAPEGSAWLAPGLADDFHSVDAGNNHRWFQPAAPAQPVSVPTSSAWALVLLALGLGLFGGRVIRRR